MAQLLFQEPDDCAGPLSRARSVHPADEAEEHSASPARGRADHSPGAGVLRLSVWCWIGRNCVPFGEPLGGLHSGAEARTDLILDGTAEGVSFQSAVSSRFARTCGIGIGIP